MAENTKEPWLEIEEHRSSSEWYSAAIHVGSPWDGSLVTLARIPQADPHWDTEAVDRMLADAWKMAAAREMFDACQEVIKAYDHDCTDIENEEYGCDGDCEDALTQWTAAEKLIRAAIAKALGKEASDVAR